MLSTPGFKQLSERVVLFLHNTSQVDGEPYPDLLREKGGNAWPTVSYLDATGRLLTQLPESPSVPQMTKTLERLEKWRETRERYADSPTDSDLGAELFVQEMEFGMLTFEEASKRFAAFKEQIGEDLRDRLTRDLVNLEFRGIAATITRDKRTMLAAGEKFVAMLQKDRIPTSRQVITFWQAALLFAESRGDADQFEQIFEAAKKAMGDDPRAQRYMDGVQRRLEALRKKQG